MLQHWKTRAKALKREVTALTIALRDPRVPWYARVVAGLVVAYALSPIDLIPDPIPVLGYLDDLVLLPLGIALVLRWIPAEVMASTRQQAEGLGKLKKNHWLAAAVIVALWVGAAVWLIRVLVTSLS